MWITCPDLGNIRVIVEILFWIFVQIVDVDTGAAQDFDGRGEVWVRSPLNMLGYANNTEATAQTIDSDGWVHTGRLNSLILAVGYRSIVK